MGKENEFLEAARTGNVGTVEKYLYQRSKRSGPLASLRRTPTTNVQDSNGYSALHYAALNGHAEVVQLLLIGNANPNIQDTRGSGPLHLAAWAGHHDIVKLLLAHNHRPADANLLTADADTPLHCAAQHGHTGALTTLLAYGADPTLTNIRGETPFDLAAQYGRLQAVQMLIRAHPDLMAPFRRPLTDGITHHHTPLHLAARNGHLRVVEMLLAAGMDVNVETPGGSALHEAALCGKDAVVRILLSSGADLGVTDSHGRTPIDLLEQFPPHVTRRIVNVITNFQHDPRRRRPRSSSPRSPARSAPAPVPKKPPRRNLSVSPTNLAAHQRDADITMRDYDSTRKLKRWRHSHFIEYCINAARCPLSPTNYLQPPTPEHAPPSAATAEATIHLHMRPLSVAFNDVATSPNSTYSATSSDSDSDSDTSDTLFRGIIVLTSSSRRDHEKSRTCITHQRFDVIDRGRLGSDEVATAMTNDVLRADDDNGEVVDLRGMMDKKEWRALSKTLELFGDEETDCSTEENELSVILNSIGLGHLTSNLIDNGFDSLPFVLHTLRSEDVGLSGKEFDTLLAALPQADKPPFTYTNSDIFDLHQWLESIHLVGYIDTFVRHLVTTWERISRIWESELQTLLEIEKVGHRRRILISLEHLKPRITNGECLEVKPLEMRNPLEVIGVVGSAKWRHQPLKLVSSAITYRAIYLGATPIDTTHSATQVRESILTLKHKEAPRSSIYLTISHRGIEQRHPDGDQEGVHEYSMRDIAFACQDADDFSHFAFITNEGRHLCHVFSAQSMDIATEIILTIGQCFEIAYQMAMNE